jgi:hypothetical protein
MTSEHATKQLYVEAEGSAESLQETVDGVFAESREIEAAAQQVHHLHELCYGGAQEIMDIYGPRPFFRALRDVMANREMTATFHDLLVELEPDEAKRRKLFDQVEQRAEAGLTMQRNGARGAEGRTHSEFTLTREQMRLSRNIENKKGWPVLGKMVHALQNRAGNATWGTDALRNLTRADMPDLNVESILRGLQECDGQFHLWEQEEKEKLAQKRKDLLLRVEKVESELQKKIRDESAAVEERYKDVLAGLDQSIGNYDILTAGKMGDKVVKYRRELKSIREACAEDLRKEIEERIAPFQQLGAQLQTLLQS